MRHLTIPGTSGFLVMLSAAMIWAQQAQDWIPEEINLPHDMEVMVDRAIGSSTRIFSFATRQDAQALMESWRQALQQGGYSLQSPPAELANPEINFSGEGIGNAKIAVQPSAQEGKSIIQFDASLTN